MKSDPSANQLTGAPARVARVLLEKGPLTASEICGLLHLTGTAVRRQLDSLVECGYAVASDSAPFGPTRPRGRGRPARIYTLTDAGRSAFSEAYDDLAVDALRYLSEILGPVAVSDFANRRADEMKTRYQPGVPVDASVSDRTRALADALTADGFVTTVESSGETGLQLCQHNCPIANAAAEFPQLCEAETEAFSELVGTHVTRLAALSHGDGICTTHIPTMVHTSMNSDRVEHEECATERSSA